MTTEQKIAVDALLTHPGFAIFDAPGSGKSRMVIEAAKELPVIDAVLVICPAAVRISWADPEFGEVQKWSPSPAIIIRKEKPISPREELTFYVVSYEFARDHWRYLVDVFAGHRVMLVADESIRIKNPTSKTCKALIKLSDAIGSRRVILNGTPGTMLDCWGQYRFLGEHLLKPYTSFYGQWRPHFSVWMTRPFPKLIKFINKPDFDKLTAPWTLRRGKSPSLPPQRFTLASVTLNSETWRYYKAMKQDMIAWIAKQPATASNAGVQIMRLAQITSGYIGTSSGAAQFSSEKIDWALQWLEEKRAEDPEFACIFWCQWRNEIDRLHKAIPGSVVIAGGQSEGDRREAIEQFTTGKGRVLIGQPHAGGLGLNLIQAHNVVYLSRDYSQIGREQSEDRCHRMGQEFPVDYIDLLAEGPNGERTIDHTVMKALKSKQDLYKWTASAWLRELTNGKV